MSLFIPTYFAPISQYAAIYKSDSIIFEVEDNYQKQTYRNRCYIYGANGKLTLNIPVKHILKENRKKTKDTLVENDIKWQQQHFKSLQSAYRILLLSLNFLKMIYLKYSIKSIPIYKI